MNLAMVRMAVAGVVQWVDGGEQDGQRGVVVARDGRRRSDEFAEEAAQVVSGAGVPALVLPDPLPTPVLAFAVRHLGAAAGLVITASHNPPQDNGVKVYGSDGAQIVPPTDGIIAAAIDNLGPLRDIPRSDVHVQRLGSEVLDAYVEQAASVATPGGPRDVKVVHTAMHGVGWEPLRRVFVAAGFPEPVATWEQAYPDAAFPTVRFPNPEEPGALDRALAVARSAKADVVLANDPDADRLGVAVREDGAWRSLSGDEIGVLLADHVLGATAGDDRLVACSIVSSSMLERMAAAHGVHFRSTLTGFKWVIRAAEDVPGARFVFGYEEALGYAVGDLVRDKDGLTAALAFAELVAALKSEARTVAEHLETLARAYGLHVTRQWSVRAPIDAIHAAVERFVAAPPSAIAGRDVTSIEHPADDIVLLHLERGARAIVRPSGTEPKIKTYYEVVVDEFDDYRAARESARDEVEALRLDLVGTLGLGA
jgi:phosphomannomutase